jgi:hypothetical protein
MKQHLFIFTLLVMMGCHERPSATTSKDSIIAENNCRQAQDTVQRVLANLGEARRNIEHYQQLCRKWKEKEPIEAYTIRAVDLLTAMGLPASLADSDSCRFKHIRVYMGYDDAIGFKLYIVPVTGACLQGNISQWNLGMDVKLDKDGLPVMRGIGSPAIESTDNYVLDLNAPCPNTCPAPGQKITD